MSDSETNLIDTVNGEIAEMEQPSSIGDLKPKTKIVGRVKRLEIYGAFIDIGMSANAILHVSKLGERVNRISDVLKVDDQVTVWVESVDQGNRQVTLTMVEPNAVDWSDLKVGQVYKGKVTRLEKFGAFVDIGAEKEGLIHVSELSNEYVKHPSEVVKSGEEVEVMVLGFNKGKRRIDLSRKALLESQKEAAVEVDESDIDEEEIPMPTAMEIAIKQAMGSSSSSSEGGSLESKSRPRRRKRKEQDDILSRTLKLGNEQ